MTFDFHPEAEAEFEEAVAFYFVLMIKMYIGSYPEGHKSAAEPANNRTELVTPWLGNLI